MNVKKGKGKKIPAIAISGGKGGTGKTFVATNVAMALSSRYKTLLVDSDVDNPNASILLGRELGGDRVEVTCFMPEFDEKKCTSCGKCADVCRFHALFHMEGKVPMLIPALCKSCQLCMRVCPEGAISRREEMIGERFTMRGPPLDLVVGRLFPGSAKTTIVIMEMMEYVGKNVARNQDIIIIDTAPGAHCDVEHAVHTADLVICVTEPTPLGGHDLGRILELCRFTGKDAWVVINRAGMADGEQGIEDMAKKYDVPVVARIPLSEDAMTSYARGVPIVEMRGELGDDHPVISAIDGLVKKMEEMIHE